MSKKPASQPETVGGIEVPATFNSTNPAKAPTCGLSFRMYAETHPHWKCESCGFDSFNATQARTRAAACGVPFISENSNA